MSLDDIRGHLKRLEAISLGMTGSGQSRKDIETKYDEATRIALSKAFPDAKKMAAFADAMPKMPGLAKILAAFPDAAKLGSFVDDALGGDPALFATLAEKGCKRDPGKLKALADEFEDNPGELKSFLAEGGLAAQPDALAALLEGGCDADPGAFREMMKKFPDAQSREKLSNALGAGGLGQCPEALGHLAKEDGGTVLATLTTTITSDTDLGKLNALLAEGGLDGGGVGRPAMLRDVLVEGLNGDPEDLLHLYDQFDGTVPGAMDRIGRMLEGLDGTDGKAGERLAGALQGFTARNTGAAYTRQEQIGKLRDPFMSSLESLGATSAQVAGTSDMADTASKAISARKAPPRELASAALQDTMTAEEAAAILAVGAAPDDLAALEQTRDAVALTDARVLRISEEAIATDASPHDVAKMTSDLKTNVEAMEAQPLGAPLAETTGLEAAIDALLDAAEVEPDVALREAALAQAKAAAKALKAALARRASAVISEGGPAGAAALSVAQSLGRASTPDEKAYLSEVSTAAATAAAVKGKTGADPKTLADAARLAFDKDTDAKDAADEAVKTATAEAKTLTNTLAALRAPIDVSVLRRSSEVVQTLLTRAGACADQGLVTTALAEAGALSDAIGMAARRAAAGQDAQVLRSFPEGKEALQAAAASDRAIGLMSVPPPGTAVNATDVAAQKQARDAALAGAMTQKDAAVFEGLTPEEQREAAKDALKRKLAETAVDGKPDAEALAAETTAANQRSDDAAKAADAARSKIEANDYGAAPPDSYDVLIQKTVAAAQSAFEAAAAAPGDTERAKALTAAKSAAKEASAAAKRFAQYGVERFRDAARADQRAKTGAAQGRRDTYLASGTANDAAEAVKGIDAANAAMSANASALMVEKAGGAPVAALMEAAAEARLKAQAPGASVLPEIEALEAQRAADEALAEKLKNDLTTALAKPEFGKSIAAGDPQATKDTVCREALEVAEAALSLCRAALSSILAFEESAQAVRTAIARHKKAIEALAETERTATEKSDLTALGARPLDPDTEFDKAATRRAQLGTQQNALATKVKTVNAAIRGKGAATEGQLSMTAGLAEHMKLEKNSGPATTLGKNDMIALAAQMVAAPLPTNPTVTVADKMKPNPSPPPPEVLDVPGEDMELDMNHLGARHLCETFDHADKEGQAKQVVGAAVKAKHFTARRHPPASKQTLKRPMVSAKKTTMYDPSTTMTDFRRLADQVTALVKRRAETRNHLFGTAIAASRQDRRHRLSAEIRAYAHRAACRTDHQDRLRVRKCPTAHKGENAPAFSGAVAPG